MTRRSAVRRRSKWPGPWALPFLQPARPAALGVWRQPPGRVRRGPKGALSRRLSAPAATMTRTRASRWWQSSSVTLFAAAAVSVRFRVAGCVAPRAGAGRWAALPPPTLAGSPGRCEARGAVGDFRDAPSRPALSRAASQHRPRVGAHACETCAGLGARGACGSDSASCAVGRPSLVGAAASLRCGGGHVLRQPCGVKQTPASGVLCPWGA